MEGVSAAGNSEDLKSALQQMLSSNVAKLEPQIGKGDNAINVKNEIDLMLKVDQTPD